MKTLNIGGEYFEVIKPRKREVIPVYPNPNKRNYFNIYQAYVRPSASKVHIWEYWNNFYGDDQYKFGAPFISGHNCYSFSIMFNVLDAETGEFLGVAHITRDHNRLYLA